MTEYKLWKYTYEVNHTATRTLSPLSYSDGTQYSLSALENGDGRRQPTMPAGSYLPPQDFRAWADSTGYGTVLLRPDSTARPRAIDRDLFDMDRDMTVDTRRALLLGRDRASSPTTSATRTSTA